MNTLRRASLSKPEEAGKAWPAIAIGAFVAFGGVLYGYVSSLNYSTTTQADQLPTDMIPVPFLVSWLCHTGSASSAPDTQTPTATALLQQLRNQASSQSFLLEPSSALCRLRS